MITKIYLRFIFLISQLREWNYIAVTILVLYHMSCTIRKDRNIKLMQIE